MPAGNSKECKGNPDFFWEADIHRSSEAMAILIYKTFGPFQQETLFRNNSKDTETYIHYRVCWKYKD